MNGDAQSADRKRHHVTDSPHRAEPQAGARALFLEAVARNLNERQTLIAGSSAADLVSAAELVDVQAQFERLLHGCEHAVYEVRRLTRRSSVRPHGRGITARSVRAVVRGSRAQMNDELRRLPGERRVGTDGIVRNIVRDRAELLPAIANIGYCIRGNRLDDWCR